MTETDLYYFLFEQQLPRLARSGFACERASRLPFVSTVRRDRRYPPEVEDTNSRFEKNYAPTNFTVVSALETNILYVVTNIKHCARF